MTDPHREGAPTAADVRAALRSHITPTLTARGFTVEPTPDDHELLDFLARRDGRTYGGAIITEHHRTADIILLAEQAALGDGLVLLSHDRFDLQRAVAVLRAPYVTATDDWVIPYTRPTPVELADGRTPVIPADAVWAWSLTRDGRLHLAVEDTIVATGAATDPVATYDYDLHHLTRTDGDATVIAPDGTVVARGKDRAARRDEWAPIVTPVVPRTGEYRSMLDLQLWYLHKGQLREVDPTARWVDEHQRHAPERRLIDYAVEVFVDTHLIQAENGNIHRDEFHDVFDGWFVAETGRATPPRAIVERYLPNRASTEPAHESFLPAYRWRVPRGISSPDLPIDREVMDR